MSAENYLSVAQGTRANIIEQTVSGHTQQVAIDRSKLVPIIKTIILCGRQELSLRGTNDSGDVLAKSSQNDGNFRSLLRFRVDAGDSALKKHLETAERNSLYTSPSIQNDIIAACGEVIKNTVVSKIKAAKCYSILADETTDISSTEQLTLCCRYFDDDAKKVCEDFLEFVPVYDVTGVGLAKVILNKVTQLGLDPNKIVGQGYDGAAAMSGHLNGVRAHISSKHPKAHSLNLAVSKSCSVPLLRNSLGTIGSVCTFLRSSQRMQLFKQQVASHLPTANFSTLIPLSETRWVERHDSVLRFLKMYIPIVNTLQELEMSHNSSAAQPAHQLVNVITKSQFVICLMVLSEFMSYTLSLSKHIQSSTCNLLKSFSHATQMISRLNAIRTNANKEFEKIFQRACELNETVAEPITMPRITTQQSNRGNISSNSAEEYCRRVVFVPYLDHLLQELKVRFESKNDIVTYLQMVTPKYAIKLNAQQDLHNVKKCVEFYKELLPEPGSFHAEFSIWQEKWKLVSESDQSFPFDLTQAYLECNGDLFPNVKALLAILLALPVSTATAERSFSTLKRLKTYLRNSTGQKRLTGLALLSIYRNTKVDIQEVVEEFVKLRPRRENFVL